MEFESNTNASFKSDERSAVDCTSTSAFDSQVCEFVLCCVFSIHTRVGRTLRCVQQEHADVPFVSPTTLGLPRPVSQHRAELLRILDEMLTQFGMEEGPATAAARGLLVYVSFMVHCLKCNLCHPVQRAAKRLRARRHVSIQYSRYRSQMHAHTLEHTGLHVPRATAAQ